jgi:hypothetical protein
MATTPVSLTIDPLLLQEVRQRVADGDAASISEYIEGALHERVLAARMADLSAGHCEAKG